MASSSKDIIGVVLDFTIHSHNQKSHWKLSDIKSVKAKAGGKPIVVQGVMCAEDAQTAVDNGADAIWVSNSGGLDSLPSSISVL